MDDLKKAVLDRLIIIEDRYPRYFSKTHLIDYLKIDWNYPLTIRFNKKRLPENVRGELKEIFRVVED